MTEGEFMAFLALLMASDPTPVSQKEDELLVRFANREAEKRGYNTWIDAFHKLGK